jgi:hypothetical protein
MLHRIYPLDGYTTSFSKGNLHMSPGQIYGPDYDKKHNVTRYFQGDLKGGDKIGQEERQTATLRGVVAGGGRGR